MNQGGNEVLHGNWVVSRVGGRLTLSTTPERGLLQAVKTAITLIHESGSGLPGYYGQFALLIIFQCLHSQ